MTLSEQIIAQTNQYGAHNYHPKDVVVAQGQGAKVVDPEGHVYYDMLSAYSALNFGHLHPEIIEVAKEQLDKVTLTSRAFHNTVLGEFFEKLAKLTGKDMVLPMNTGAEAVETALKAARRWGTDVKGVPDGQQEVIVCENNFHGRTITIISFSTDPSARRGYGPYTPGFKVIPYGDAAALEAAITPNTVAFLVEPIQGEAGILVPPQGFLQAARKICTEHRVLMIADEVQTGFARTGELFACDHEGVKPDVYILGKALGGGVMPISAVVADREVLEVFEPGSHGSTFGGNPLACAVAIKAMEIIVRDDYAGQAKEKGAYFRAKLEEIKKSNPQIAEVRGKGLLIGVEFAGSALPYVKRLIANGILAKETHESTIRFAPPITISYEELDDACAKIAAAFAPID